MFALFTGVSLTKAVPDSRRDESGDLKRQLQAPIESESWHLAQPVQMTIAKEDLVDQMRENRFETMEEQIFSPTSASFHGVHAERRSLGVRSTKRRRSSKA